ncbi:MAG TPA: hypothetical protein DEB40_02110 [Elusimicrobia bacterium]|nr:hypothetical protein [Elusimicrobiota bacterium]HBT60525.1 hypothetical protein [Elusimicrobiota bacterium]
MRALLLAFLLFLPGRALARGEQRRMTLLLVPPETFSEWESLSAAFAAYPQLKLTLALTPAMIRPHAAAILAPLVQAGRLEIAMRIPGDPILPLIEKHPMAPRPQDIPDRIALCREEFKAALNFPVAGLVPGGGGAAADMIPMLRALGISWIAVGPYEPPVLASEARSVKSSLESSTEPARSAFLPFAALRAESRIPGPGELDAWLKPGDKIRLVADEAGGLVPPGSCLSLLRGLSEKRPSWTWETVFKSSSAALSSEVQDWPGWGAGSWNGRPAQEAAWKAYGEAAAAVKRYQNSGTADLKALENAANALYAAQSSRYYRLLGLSGSEAKEADRELRQRLISVYRRLKQPAPGELYASWLGSEAAAATENSSEESPTDVRISRGAAWISFQNPAGSLSRPLPGESKASDAWKILDFQVEWDISSVTFLLRMASLDNSTSAAHGQLGRLVQDVYVDINHVPGAGSSSLLDGRSAFAANRDCWEFALSLGPAGAALWRASSGSDPAWLADIPIDADPASKSIRARVPRSLLRGNPARWGYIVAAFAALPAASSQDAQPQVLPGGPLGILAPLEQQRGLGPGQRLAAVRGEP